MYVEKYKIREALEELDREIFRQKLNIESYWDLKRLERLEEQKERLERLYYSP